MGRFEKILFVVSLAMLTFLYGFGACARGWFPKQLLLGAWGQAERTGVVTFMGQYLPGSPGVPDFLHPQVYDRAGARILEPEKIQPGLTLITTAGWEPEPKLINREGEVVHNWQIDFDKLTGAINEPVEVHGSHLLPNGNLLINAGYVGTARFDACGRVQWQIPRGHHSISRAADGSFWVSSISEKRQTKSTEYPEGFPGLDRPVYLDKIHHVAEDGEILQTINVLDVLYSNGLQRYIAKTYFGREVDPDITHLNDVEPLNPSMAKEYPLFEAGDLVVSLKHLNLVFVFDPESKEVKWHATSPFIDQHDPDFLGDGWVGIFDNNSDLTPRGTMLGGSRIVALHPHTDSTEVLFPAAHSDTVYTAAQGKWQRLENGNMLLTESFASRVVEVAPDGRVVWDWVHETSGNSKVPEVTEGTRYDLTRVDVASWPCSSADSTRVR
jgi:hypothetical protein